MTAFLSITDLTVGYGATPVLRGITLDVSDADFTAIVGPSGCGKTTLLRTIAGLERATSGDMRLGTQMLTTHGIHLAPHKRNIGWVPQDASLFPHLNVAENIAFGLATSLRRVKKAARSNRVAELLELVSLTAFGLRMPHELSGGQAQRVALARALANRPQLVLLDEPFAGLDPILRSDLRSEVKAILARAQTAALLVTHDQTEALSLASHVALMHDGIIEQAGSPLDVYSSPATVWCAEFLGDANVLHATTVQGESDPNGLNGPHDSALSALGITPMTWMEGGTQPVPGELVSLMVRPESLSLVTGQGWRVTETSFAGHDGLVTLVADTKTPLAARSHTTVPVLQVLVAARQMPLIGANYDVKLTAPALGYAP